MTADNKVVVVGGGPVGALAALYAARRGYETELYELRGDPNGVDPALRPDIAVIPVTLSERGVHAIAGANVPGLLEGILQNSRDTVTRMVHIKDGDGNEQLKPMKYGPNGERYRTLPRDKITKFCLAALAKEPTAKLFFNYKMVSCDFDNQTVGFESVHWVPGSRESEQSLADDAVSRSRKPGYKPTKLVSYGFLIGADGAYSSVRQCMMRSLEVDLSQQYCSGLWNDFVIPPDSFGRHRIDQNCIHVWPAGESVLVAQSDSDGSFRAGMVCPTKKVRYHEKHPEHFGSWFKEQFAGVVPDLLTEEEATSQFLKNQKIPLKSLKINKFGYEDSVLLLGDSVHTMPPFYGMGMITGLEDVRVFFQQFRDPAAAQIPQTGCEKTSPPFCPQGTIASYAAHRLPDVHAMVDLANAHYHELKNGVRSPIKRARKVFDSSLSRWAPFLGWTTLYARIHFGNDRLSDAVRKEERQEMVWKAGWIGVTLFLIGVLFS